MTQRKCDYVIYGKNSIRFCGATVADKAKKNLCPKHVKSADNKLKKFGGK